MSGTLLDEKLYPMWVSNSFPVIRIILFVLVVASCLAIIITTLLQNEDSNGTDVITGQQESYYSQNKGGSRDGKLRLATIICSCIAVGCVLLYFISLLIYPAAIA